MPAGNSLNLKNEVIFGYKIKLTVNIPLNVWWPAASADNKEHGPMCPFERGNLLCKRPLPKILIKLFMLFYPIHLPAFPLHFGRCFEGFDCGPGMEWWKRRHPKSWPDEFHNECTFRNILRISGPPASLKPLLFPLPLRRSVQPLHFGPNLTMWMEFRHCLVPKIN